MITCLLLYASSDDPVFPIVGNRPVTSLHIKISDSPGGDYDHHGHRI